MGFRRKQPEEPRVELTAMIDVVFLLLIFFMISTTFIERSGLSIDLPAAGAEALKQQESVIHVYLTAAGEIYLERDKVSFAQLKAQLGGYPVAEAKDMTFMLMADKETSHGRVVELMDVAKSAGFSQLAIATERVGESERDD
jgi:biopolymer transport protein ExbD/biopolymer transport protein TolR